MTAKARRDPQKGVKPQFPFCYKTQVIQNPSTGALSWKKCDGTYVPIQEMTEKHLLQAKRAIEDNGYKHSRMWYLFDQELRRRGKGLTYGIRQGEATWRHTSMEQS